jgi:hypothetical protein
LATGPHGCAAAGPRADGGREPEAPVGGSPPPQWGMTRVGGPRQGRRRLEPPTLHRGEWLRESRGPRHVCLLSRPRRPTACGRLTPRVSPPKACARLTDASRAPHGPARPGPRSTDGARASRGDGGRGQGAMARTARDRLRSRDRLRWRSGWPVPHGWPAEVFRCEQACPGAAGQGPVRRNSPSSSRGRAGADFDWSNQVTGQIR